MLFFADGILSIVVPVKLLADAHYLPWLVMLQGAVLSGWISVQVGMFGTVYFLHIILVATGTMLIITGYLLKRLNNCKIRLDYYWALSTGFLGYQKLSFAFFGYAKLAIICSWGCNLFCGQAQNIKFIIKHLR